MQDAFAIALERWPRDGTPANPGAWIITTARNRAIDRLRREQTFARKAELLARLEALPAEEDDVSSIPDDRLALVFTCCHPALAAEARVALTLREVAGLTTPEIAHAFLVAEPAMAQRLVRAKRKIRDAGDPVPRPARPPAARAAALGARRALPRLQRGLLGERRAARPCATDLCDEAIRLAKLLAVLMPDEPEALGLLALMLLHDARREARTAPDGSIVLLEDQDRSRWSPARIARAPRVLERALSLRRPGPYQLQAAIAALHVEEGETDWPQIAALYAELARLEPSPIVELNRAVAVAMARRPGARPRAARADRPARLPPAARGPRRPPAPARPPRRGRRVLPGGARAGDERRRPGVPGVGGSPRWYVRDVYRERLPQLDGGVFLTDGGIETTLIFHRGLDLPEFAAFDLLKDDAGTEELRRYYAPYAQLAREHGVGLVLESPTWRANPDWAAKIGYSLGGARRVQPQGDRADGGAPRGVRRAPRRS